MPKKNKEKKKKTPYTTPQREGYRAADISYSFAEGNIYGTLAAVTMFVAVLVLGYILHGGQFLADIYHQQDNLEVTFAVWILRHTNMTVRHACIAGKGAFCLMVISSMFFLVLIHELTHKYTWALWIPKEERKKVLYIGFKAMTPFAGCTADLPIMASFIGAISPMILTGVTFAAAGLIAANPLLTVFGAVGTSAGGGDILTAMRMRPFLKYRKLIDRDLGKGDGCVAADLDDRMGCVIYIPEDCIDGETGKIRADA